MKKKKKWLIVVVSLLLVVTISVGVYCSLPVFLVRNVFDEMYYSLKQEPNTDDIIVFTNNFYYTDTSFYNVSEISKSQNGKSRFYDYPYSTESELISIHYSDGDDDVRFRYKIWMVAEGEQHRGLFFQYLYQPKNKTLSCTMKLYDSITPLDGEYEIDHPSLLIAFLEEYNITRDQIEAYKDFVLYERVLPDWFAGNAGLSKYSMEYLGDFTFDDQTYIGLDGWAACLSLPAQRTWIEVIEQRIAI